MNRFFSSIILLLTLAQLTDAQTRVWKIPGYYTQLQEDGIGNAYICTGTNLPADSLKKISPRGDVIWSVGLGEWLSAVPKYSGSGVYVLPRRHLNSNSVPETLAYYDTAGTKLWYRPFPEQSNNSVNPGYPSIDQNGNLLLQYDSLPAENRGYGTFWAPTNRRLIKIGPGGRELFNIQLPLLSRKHVRIDRFSDPTADALNNIWIVATAETLTINESTPAFNDYGTVYLEAMLFNGTSGNLIASYPLWEGINWIDKRNNAGQNLETYYVNGDYPYSSVATVGDKLVAYGSFMYESERFSGSKTIGKSLSEWRLAVVGESGKTRYFKYKGKSVFTYGGIRTDNTGNELFQVLVANDGSLYLHGLISSGRSLETSTQNDVLLKLSSGNYQLKWKIIGASSGPYPTIPTMIHIGSQKIFRNPAPNTLAVYGLNGVAGTSLEFPGSLDINPTGPPDGVSYLQGPQVEPGYFYVRDGDATGVFLSKYNLPAIVQPATSKGQAIDDLQASTFEVSQNYPNPFNPTTTIHVELSTDALVTIKVFNLLGQEVATLADHEALVEGANNLEFDGSQLPSGTYFYRTVAEDVESGKVLFTTAKRMMLIK